MFCNKCGKNNPEEAVRCKYCGSEMPKAFACTGFGDILSFENGVPEKEEVPKIAEEKPKKQILAIIAIVLSIAAIAVSTATATFVALRFADTEEEATELSETDFEDITDSEDAIGIQEETHFEEATEEAFFWTEAESETGEIPTAWAWG